jgi:ADP-ribose pyrophosphatase
VDGDSQVCLLRQYRHAAGGWIWELPAGLIEPEEPPRATAERELLEEAGVRAARWEPLGKMYSSPGFCTEQLHLYLARDLTIDESFTAREDEVIEVHWTPFDEALEMAASGKIQDAKTVVTLFRASRGRTNATN